jgi:DNA polymerase III delta prime subunit
VFCLMCNYISKIETSLKCEFIELKFNKLPTDDIINFLQYIIKNENINISRKHLIQIQELFQSDIRSMINYIQSNYVKSNINISTSKEILKLFSEIKTKNSKNKIYTFCNKYNVTPKECFIKMFTLLVKNNQIKNNEFIKSFELIIHDYNYNVYELEHIINLFSIIN